MAGTRDKEIRVKQLMPAPLFSPFSRKGPRIPEDVTMYRGDRRVVPKVLEAVFGVKKRRVVIQEGMSLPEVQEVFLNADKETRKITPTDFDDRRTACIVLESISMAASTIHPSAIGDQVKVFDNQLDRICSKNEGEVVNLMDVGCGPGVISMIWLERSRGRGLKTRLTGLDPSPVHIEMADWMFGSENGKSWIEADGQNLPIRNRSGDLDSSHDVFHHLSVPQAKKIVGELVRVADTTIITDPTGNRLARLIVGGITKRRLVHRQAIDSYDAAHGMRVLLADIVLPVTTNNGHEVYAQSNGFIDTLVIHSN